jgi:RNA polymerase sigma-70 factor (family 1)
LTRQEQILNYWKKVVLNSDSKAFEQFFYLLNARCIKFCRQYVSDKESAEELVSDVFVDFWLNRQKLSNVKNPEVYILVCVKNKSLNHFKKNSRMQVVSLDAEVNEVPDVYRHDEELEKKELFLQLDKAINSLPLQCKVVFKLVKEDGMKCADVAQILNISVRTVHAQIYRAMNKLNSIMVQSKELRPSAVVRHIASAIAIFLFIYFL